MRVEFEFGVPVFNGTPVHCNSVDCKYIDALATWTAHHEDGGMDTYHCDPCKVRMEREV